MKLWYQSLARHTEFAGYPKALKAILDSVKDPGTEIEVHGLERVGGIGNQYRYLEFLETGEVLENVNTAIERGFDGFLIGNIGDPGLREAKEIADFPVLGLCESALHVACMMGASFAFITINEKFTPRVIENVVRYGLKDRFAGAFQMQVDRLLDLDTAYTDPAASRRLVDQFQEAARAATRAGAEVVIAAGGVVMAFLAHAQVYRTEDGTPILNGIVNLVKLGETAVKLQHITGGFASRRASFARPPAGQISELRRFYGDRIYPTIGKP
jgi:allantoin racemase